MMKFRAMIVALLMIGMMATGVSHAADLDALKQKHATLEKELAAVDAQMEKLREKVHAQRTVAILKQAAEEAKATYEKTRENDPKILEAAKQKADAYANIKATAEKVAATDEQLQNDQREYEQINDNIYELDWQRRLAEFVLHEYRQRAERAGKLKDMRELVAEAEKQYEKAKEDDARYQATLRKLRQAEEEFVKAADQLPEKKELDLATGTEHRNWGRYSRAYHDYQRALARKDVLTAEKARLEAARKRHQAVFEASKTIQAAREQVEAARETYNRHVRRVLAADAVSREQQEKYYQAKEELQKAYERRGELYNSIRKRRYEIEKKHPEVLKAVQAYREADKQYHQTIDAQTRELRTLYQQTEQAYQAAFQEEWRRLPGAVELSKKRRALGNELRTIEKQIKQTQGK